MARGLKKGQTNNPNGRPKGVANKVTTDLRTFYSKLIDDNREEIVKRLKRLDDASFFQALDRINKYVLPTLSATTIDATIDSSTRIGKMSEEQINRLIDEVLEEDGRIKRATN